MTDQRTDRNIEQTLTAWMDQVAPDRPPTRLLEGTFTRTMSARQLRRFPWNNVTLGRVGTTATGSGARLALVVLSALLGLALSVGLIGGVRIIPPSVPSPTPVSSPSLPAPIAVTPESTVPVQGPIAMAARGSAVWVMAPGRLDRIDPATNTVGASGPLGPTTDLYNGIATNTAGLWASDADAAVVYRFDPDTLKVVKAIPAGSSPKGVLATDAIVWVADVHGGSVLRIDPATNTAGVPISVGPTGPSGPNWLGLGLGSLWIGIPNTASIVRIDPDTNAIQGTVKMPTGTTSCGGFAVGTTAVWITSCSSSPTIAHVDPASNTVVATVDIGGNGYDPTLINGVPWVSVDTGAADSGMLVRIDPATNTVDRVLVPTTTFGGGGDIVVLAGSVWVSDGYNNVVLRLPMSAFAP